MNPSWFYLFIRPRNGIGSYESVRKYQMAPVNLTINDYESVGEYPYNCL